jgi:hypothetical protein
MAISINNELDKITHVKWVDKAFQHHLSHKGYEAFQHNIDACAPHGFIWWLMVQLVLQC